MTTAIHRLVEQQAAKRGADVAIVDADRCWSYRELNVAANSLARELIGKGFRRGGHAYVKMSPSADLAAVLLAVLKAGGCYTICHIDSACSVPEGVSIQTGRSQAEQQYLCIPQVDVNPAACSPNLPVITRPTDTACVLEGDAGAPTTITHGDIVAMAFDGTPEEGVLHGKGAVQGTPKGVPYVERVPYVLLWIALITGCAVVFNAKAIGEQAATMVAA